MKEATGELNMSLIVISAVAGLSAFFFGWLWPNMQKNQEEHTACSYATCDKNTLDANGYVKCSYSYSKNGSNKSGVIKCKYKG